MFTATHEIVEARAYPSSHEGALDTSCTFIPNTTARGYLAIVSTLPCNDGNRDHPVFTANYNTAGTCDTTNGIGSGDYSVALLTRGALGYSSALGNLCVCECTDK